MIFEIRPCFVHSSGEVDILDVICLNTNYVVCAKKSIFHDQCITLDYDIGNNIHISYEVWFPEGPSVFGSVLMEHERR